MRHVIHLMAADARRCRWALLLWIAVAVIGAASYAALWRASTPAAGQMAANAVALLSLAGILLSVALVPLVVHGDPAVGGGAFWMTRPVRPAALAAAKILLLSAVLVGLPMLLEIVAMAATGMPPREMWLASLQMGLFRAVPLAILLSVAALTPTMTRYVVWCVGILVAAALLLSFGAGALSALRDSALWRSVLALVAGTPDGTLLASRMVLAALVLVTAGLLAVLHQYRRRSRASTFGILGAGAACAVLVAAAWPWSTFHRNLPAPAWAEDPVALRLEVTGQVSWNDPSGAAANRLVSLLAMGGLQIPPTPGHWRVWASLREASIEPVEGPRIDSRHRPGISTLAAADRAERGTLLLQALDVDRLAGSRLEPGPGLLFAAPSAALRAPVVRRGRYRGVFELMLAEVDIAATLSLEAGATFQSEGYRFVLDGVELDDNVIRLSSRTAAISSIFDPGPRPQYEFFLRHRGRREALRGSRQLRNYYVIVPGAGTYPVGGESTGFSRVRVQILFGPGRGAGAFAEIDEEWLAGAELVIVRSRRSGRVERTLTIDDFPLPPSDTQGRAASWGR